VLKWIKRLVWSLLVLDAILAFGSGLILALPSKSENYAGAGFFVILVGASILGAVLGFILFGMRIWEKQRASSGPSVE
jgi:hypothetical protein